VTATPRFALILMAGLLSLPLLSTGRTAEKEKPRAFAKLQRGMTPEQVRQCVGQPKRIARQILYHHYREQWLYDTPHSTRLTFECQRGQKPELLEIRPPRTPSTPRP
jgi:hypothetical protein